MQIYKYIYKYIIAINMKILFYTCVQSIHFQQKKQTQERLNKILLLLGYCVNNLFKTQKYDFDYMLMVGNDNILPYKFALYHYPKIKYKNHKDFKYYEKYKDAKFNICYQDEIDLVYHSKVFIAIEMLEQYDVVAHIDYDFMILENMYDYIIKHKDNYDCSSYSDGTRIGTELIFYYNRTAFIPYYDIVLNTPLVRQEEIKMLNLHLNNDCLYQSGSIIDFTIDRTKFSIWVCHGFHISCSNDVRKHFGDDGTKLDLYNNCLAFLFIISITSYRLAKGIVNHIHDVLNNFDSNSQIPDWINNYESVIKTALKRLNIDYIKYL